MIIILIIISQCPHRSIFTWIKSWWCRQKIYQWLGRSWLKAGTERFILAAQDQSLSTNIYQAKKLKNGSEPRCCICSQYDGTNNHIISGCPNLVLNEYWNRHNRVAYQYGNPYAKSWHEITQKLLENLEMSPSYGIIVYKQTEELNKPNITFKEKTKDVQTDRCEISCRQKRLGSRVWKASKIKKPCNRSRKTMVYRNCNASSCNWVLAAN